MSTPIPPPLRAAAGLAAVAIDSARKLPQQVVGLPVLAVSAALQVSLKAQQRYAQLIARGDEVLGQLRGLEDSPAWARFDDEPGPGGPAVRPKSAFEAAPDPELLDQLAADQLGGGEPEADLLADAEAGLDGAAVLEPDGVAATEAEVGGLDVAEIPLDRGAPGPAGPDGYVAADPPIPRYDELSVPQLRGRLRTLSVAQLDALVAYERATAARPAYLAMLENRLATLRSP